MQRYFTKAAILAGNLVDHAKAKRVIHTYAISQK